MTYDVVIIGGGPAGLAAALALGRARKQVLLCDAGPRRNAAAERIHNFVTRDGTPPEVFRQEARAQLAAYPNVTCRDVGVEAVDGARGAFELTLTEGKVRGRRILLATGMIDQMIPLEGFRELWGHSIFQCPYCHGWEVKDRRWGLLALEAVASHLVPFALQASGWSPGLVVFTGALKTLPTETVPQLERAGLQVELREVRRLVSENGALQAVELADGTRIPCDVLFAHPPQRQVPLVERLAPALDAEGYVQIDAQSRQTSIPGIYAAGDLASRAQGAIFSAAAGTQAAAVINVDLAMDRLS